MPAPTSAPGVDTQHQTSTGATNAAQTTIPIPMGLFDRFKRRQAEHENPAPDSSQPTGAVAPPAASRIVTALNKTRAFLASAFAADPEGLVDDEFFEDFVEGLVLADVGLELASRIGAEVRQGLEERGLVHLADANKVANAVIANIFTSVELPPPLEPGQLAVVMLVGVNGSGKTTLCAKLASRLKARGLKVLLVAADTFRAAAVEQLKIWAGRAGVEIVAGQEGADPASVVFDAATAAAARGTDVMLVDTAGRLQTKANLMLELQKVARTIEKACPGANIAHLLVLDATVGLNALSQAELFNQSCPLSGVAVTKMDGTAKGGAVLAVVDKLKVPLLYLGVGEQLGDLLDFDAHEFAAGLLPG